jgi:hypothetical protein
MGEGEDGWYEGEGDWMGEGEDAWYEGEGDWMGEGEEAWYEGEGDWMGEGENGWYEGEGDWMGEGENGWYEGEGDWMGEGEGAWYEGEGGPYDGGEAAWYGEQGYTSFEGPFEEVDEMALAAEILNAGSEQEFGKLLKGLINFATGGKGSAGAKGSLAKMAKAIGRRFLPLAGATAGNLVAPGVGGMVGGSLLGKVGQMFGLETEGMSLEDGQYEIARRYVRLVGAAAQEVAQTPPAVPPDQAAQQALAVAAQQHAPGLMVPPASAQARYRGQFRRYGGRYPRRRAQGVWAWRGNNIVLYGIR